MIDSKTFKLESGFNPIDIRVDNDTDIKIVLPERTTGSAYIRVFGTGKLTLNIIAEQYSNFKTLWINQSDTHLDVHEHIILEEKAILHAHYGEMTKGNHHKNTHIEYRGQGSWCDVKGAVISFNNLNWRIKADHQAKKSYAMVSCNAIVLDHADLKLEIIGSISKGNSGSETHQLSRIMNLGENVHGIVYPMLLIDENDVAASHAASVGQPNEEHIYYLQSRGLSRVEALKQLIMGYLMPIVEGIDDETIKKQLTQEIEEKVNTQW